VYVKIIASQRWHVFCDAVYQQEFAFMCVGSRTWAVILTVLDPLDTVTGSYISWEYLRNSAWLLQIANRERYVGCRIVPCTVTLSNRDYFTYS